MKDIILELKTRLAELVQGNNAKALLFSGGLDSAILARFNSNIKTITVSLESYGEDIKHASYVATLLNIEHYQKRIAIDEAIDSIPQVIKILGTFDPAIPNDLVVYLGLKQAKEMGIEEVMTGDGSDELFAGYDFMQDIGDLGRYIKRISQRMEFSSGKLGEFFGISVIQPFADKDIVDFALQIPVDLKLKKDNGKVWGKWVLRKAFEDMLPKEIIWQDKRPLEYGSGMTKLRDIISAKITDEEFEKADRTKVKFMNKEHFYYYKIYKNIVGKIPKPCECEKECPGCGAGMHSLAFHCDICGYTSDWRT